MAIAAILLGFIMQFAGTIDLTRETEEINELFKGYLNVPAYIMSIGVFTLVKFCGEKLQKIQGLIYFLSQYTFGIYLIHIFFVMYIPDVCDINTSSILWRTIGPIFIFGSSCFCCMIVRKIPGLKWLLP